MTRFLSIIIFLHTWIKKTGQKKIALATADNPLGPFKVADPFMSPPERWLIRFECDLFVTNDN